MLPQEIEKIANSVVGGFSRPTAASAGCGGTSDTQPFDCGEPYTCDPSYACGGAGPFDCDGTGFVCIATFDCPAGAAPFSCVGGYSP